MLYTGSLIAIEGMGQTAFGSNYGDGFATDSRVQVRGKCCQCPPHEQHNATIPDNGAILTSQVLRNNLRACRAWIAVQPVHNHVSSFPSHVLGLTIGWVCRATRSWIRTRSSPRLWRHRGAPTLCCRPTSTLRALHAWSQCCCCSVHNSDVNSTSCSSTSWSVHAHVRCLPSELFPGCLGEH